jgi:hypothetical protein
MKSPEIIHFDDRFLYIRGHKINITEKLRKDFASILDKSDEKFLNAFLHGKMVTNKELEIL